MHIGNNLSKIVPHRFDSYLRRIYRNVPHEGNIQQGFKNIVEVTKRLEKNLGVTFNVHNINDWGYELVAQKNLEAALQVFKLNVALHPNVANSFDSLGETHVALKLVVID